LAGTTNPYRILDRKRCGERLSDDEIAEVVAGSVDGSWSEAQLAAFLMASAVRGLDADETRALTLAMLKSGAQWNLAADYPTVGDKHSTGGVGDKVSLILCPILAVCGQPIVMLTGRGLGHTGGTADKLETIPGLDLALDRGRCGRLLDDCGMAVGMATAEIAPADRTLYALRDQTGTVVSIPLITASILSKKLATGAAGVVFDVKTGNGAFLSDSPSASELAEKLVETSTALGTKASAIVTDMSQPLGRWAGHTAEVAETIRCLENEGPEDLMEVVFVMCEEVSRLAGEPLDRQRLREAVSSGRARERFFEWVEIQGGDARDLSSSMDLGTETTRARSPRTGYLAGIATRRLGLLLAEVGGGRVRADDVIDPSVSLEMHSRVGDGVIEGQELARLHMRRPDDRIARELTDCFEISEGPAEVPPLIGERFTA
jgi:pyrimidine-nucleoside phosphorylase